MQKEQLTTAKVANLAGVHRDTLLRWLRAKSVPEPSRDRRGWRVFTRQEARQIANYARTGAKEFAESAQDSSIRRLQDIDWNFAEAKTRYLTHGLHPYPAKFIPQIPNALIQELSSVGETVADIFCGSGTTLLEALYLKRNVIGIDANPIACLVSKAKTTPLSEDEEEEVRNHLKVCKSVLSGIDPKAGDIFYSGKSFESVGWRPENNISEFWFMPHVVEELAEIHRLIQQVKLPNAIIFCRAVFSAIIVSVSKQDSDTRYVRSDKKIGVGHTLTRYIEQVGKSLDAVVELSDIVEDRFSCEVVEANILESPPVDKFDLVVSSPPYPNAYSYHLYHRLRLHWLGLDEKDFKKIEIGSHRKYSAKGKNKATAETFADEFRKIFEWLKPRLKVEGYACFVVGDSKIDGRVIDNATIISDAARSLDFVDVDRIEREILQTKKALNPKIGRIRKEKIMILRNG